MTRDLGLGGARAHVPRERDQLTWIVIDDDGNIPGPRNCGGRDTYRDAIRKTRRRFSNDETSDEMK